MAANLVIVESPAKAKTIAKLLGDDYLVKPSFGHIRDLAKKNYGIDIENNFEPKYEIDADKKAVVADLRKEVKAAKQVWLASDEDREGEAIAWHLAVTLKLPVDTTKRIVFHEITKKAIEEAVKNPRTIDTNLVNAQQARRILDRLVGFELSEVLWKKVKSSLSAGRVQSVAVRLIVEREREIINFVSTPSFKAQANFSVPSSDAAFRAEYNGDLADEDAVKKFLDECNGADFVVNSVVTKPGKHSPAAPFTTSTLQQEASRKLGFSVSQTMSLAQSLYESGFITYMRTDSTNLSDVCMNSCKDFITKEYGAAYSKPRQYKTKTKGAQEAHEAIRPTSMQQVVSQKWDEQRLYEIILKRTLASQMADAQIERTTVKIDAKGTKHQFQASGEVIKFDGFLKVYSEGTDDETAKDEQLLPALQGKESISLSQMEVNQRFSRPNPRYTEASLVKRLEELGIGRPSTYAPIITTIIKRGYVIKEDRNGVEREYVSFSLKGGKVKRQIKKENTGAEKNKLFCTDIAMVVTDFLGKHFHDIMDYNFTATVEKYFDDIASGDLEWTKMLHDFYEPFHDTTQKSIEEGERSSGERLLGTDPESGKPVSVRIGRFGPIVQLGNNDDAEKPVFASLLKSQHIESITLEEALELLSNELGGTLLGVDPKSGKNVYARVSRFGPMVQLGEADDPEKPKYATILKPYTIDNITLDQALKFLELPRDLGEYEGYKIKVAVGRFGPYVSWNSKFVSLKKTDDPMTVSYERCIELIKEKAEKDANNLIKEFNDNLRIVRDRWGHPTIWYKKKYFKLSSQTDPATLSEADCLKIAGVDPEKETTKKSASATKTTTKKTSKK